MLIQKEELSKKIDSMKSVVPKGGTVAAIQGILLSDGYLTATNHEITIRARLEGAGEESFVIPQKAFDLIKNLPEGEMEISPAARHGVNIKAGSINNTFQSVDPALFEAGKFLEGDSQGMAVDSADLKRCIKNVLYAVDKKKPGQKMGALCIKCAEGFLDFAGTDGYVMAWDRLAYEGEEMELLVPRDAAEKLLQLDFSGEVQVRCHGSGAIFVTKDYVVKTSLIEGPYVPYAKMFAEMPVHAVADRKGLIDAANRAAMCMDADARLPIRLQFEGDSVRVHLKARNAKYSEDVPLEKKMEEPMLMAFNPKLLLESLKVFDVGKVHMSMASGIQPLLIDAEGMELQTLVLPVIIKE